MLPGAEASCPLLPHGQCRVRPVCRGPAQLAPGWLQTLPVLVSCLLPEKRRWELRSFRASGAQVVLLTSEWETVSLMVGTLTAGDVWRGGQVGPGRHLADVGPEPVCRVNRVRGGRHMLPWASLSRADGGIAAPPSPPRSGHPRPGAAGQWEGHWAREGEGRDASSLASTVPLSLAHRGLPVCVHVGVSTCGRECVCTYGCVCPYEYTCE